LSTTGRTLNEGVVAFVGTLEAWRVRISTPL